LDTVLRGVPASAGYSLVVHLFMKGAV
jgi:hypothetical protein